MEEKHTKTQRISRIGSSTLALGFILVVASLAYGLAFEPFAAGSPEFVVFVLLQALGFSLAIGGLLLALLGGFLRHQERQAERIAEEVVRRLSNKPKTKEVCRILHHLTPVFR